MKSPRAKKCRCCGDRFVPTRAIQPVCSKYECMVEFAQKAAEKSALARKKKEARQHREAKLKIKTWQQWFNEAKEVAQKYARIRDYHLGCVSCSKPPNWRGQWHGSHFKPAGNFKAVALNLWNIHKACSECNNFKSGNLIEMADTLVTRIGQEKVDWLKSQTQPYRHSIEYLARYKKVIGKRCRMMEKRLNLNH